ncbi:MAG: NAD(P)-dependent oxidoreductase [Acidimicrobiaceae bacterium]|nr:NAD(P)-dependent oxidoreductase [Acidimicrobiaceae bacterium]MYD05845.1 NAD(P)-dependent oxidoreductase [Acidimicrobiaceae bacterium]MYI59183.1 NAD(P)-dependent oxidoreductase [Acidimicrobiaceae bacterium]
MRIGFVGLGNLGSKLAGSLLRNGVDLVVRDLDEAVVRSFIERGATSAASPKKLAERCDVVITCLPSPTTCAEVMEAADGVLAGLDRGKLWLEMTTTDESEVRRLATLASERGAMPIECPVSGGCHRAATGNISIFCGGTREAFDLALPILAMMGRKILHTGPLGSASILKVVTNYLASVNLVSIGEAFAVAHQCGIDLTTAYEAIHISSGTSFVHETEGQVILNGSYDIGFTLDLVQKDMSLFMDLAERAELPLEVAPVVLEMFNDAATRYGSRALSPRVVQRYEDAVGAEFRAPGFPAELIDDEPEQPGYEVVIDPG